jgi:hypothetical protein
VRERHIAARRSAIALLAVGLLVSVGTDAQDRTGARDQADARDHAGEQDHSKHKGHKMGLAGKMPRLGLGASATFDSNGTLWVVSTAGDHTIVRGSRDFGKSWSHPVIVNPISEPVEADGDARPKITAGPKGNLYVTWTKPLSKPFSGEIRFSRSVDGGKSFSAPIAVHSDRQEITHRFDAVSVSRDGRVFVAWVDKRDLAKAESSGGPAYAGAAIYYAVSDDGGRSFRGDYKIADHSCECCRIALLPQQDGSVLACWRHVFSPNIRDHALARIYPDGHIDGFRRATFDNWQTDACPHHGPSLAADSAGRLHAVWFDLGPEQPGALYGRLHVGGVDGLRRIGGETAEHPDLAVIGNRVAIAWKEFDGEKSQLRAMLSMDDGNTWRETTLGSTTGPSDQPRLLTSKGKFYVFWNTAEQPFTVLPVS